MSIRVYNTLSKSKEPFEPIAPGKVGIYLCGPTVYKPSHIGHMVGPVIFDAVKRYLTYCGYQVTWVVNVTENVPGGAYLAVIRVAPAAAGSHAEMFTTPLAPFGGRERFRRSIAETCR